jgi:hypothetical protein
MLAPDIHPNTGTEHCEDNDSVFRLENWPTGYVVLLYWKNGVKTSKTLRLVPETKFFLHCSQDIMHEIQQQKTVEKYCALKGIVSRDGGRGKALEW